jgi:hypothetical protein
MHYGGVMARLRPGIEYPIIPEDIITSEEEFIPLNQEQEHSSIMRCYPDGMSMDDWMAIERIIHQCPER